MELTFQVNGIPFEIKTIHGMVKEHDVVEGHQEFADQNEAEKECLVCLTEEKNTVIMPCGHMCVCLDCGNGLVKAKHTCPICRGNIQSLIPMKK